MSRAGAFRDQVTFQHLPDDPETDIDDYGNQDRPWETIATVMADIREMPGRERFAAGRAEGTRIATVRVRSEPAVLAVTPADRLIARGATWNITSDLAQIDARGEVLEFTAETGGAV